MKEKNTDCQNRVSSARQTDLNGCGSRLGEPHIQTAGKLHLFGESKD